MISKKDYNPPTTHQGISKSIFKKISDRLLAPTPNFGVGVKEIPRSFRPDMRVPARAYVSEFFKENL